jgi:hypothetical protein
VLKGVLPVSTVLQATSSREPPSEYSNGWSSKHTSLKEVNENDDLIIGQISLLLLYMPNSIVSNLGGGHLHFVLSASSVGVSSHGLSKGIVENVK